MHLTREKGGGRRGIKEKVIEYLLHESRRKECLRAEMDHQELLQRICVERKMFKEDNE